MVTAKAAPLFRIAPFWAFRKLAALFCVMVLAGRVFAGEGERFVTDNWQTDSGLPNNSISALLQTKDRYLWIGTSNGLARFDGVRFTTFASVGNPGLRSDRILSLFEGADGALWIGTQEGGLARMFAGQFTTFSPADGLSSDTINCLTEDADGSLWIGTASGLDRESRDRFSSFLKNDGLPDDRVLSMVWSGPTASVLLGTANGLARIKSREIRATALNEESLAGAKVRALLFSRKNILYAGCEKGLFQISNFARDQTSSRQITSNAVSFAIERSDGDIWCGTTTGKLLRIDLRMGEVRTEAQFGSAITALREDRERNLWVGTQADGLYRLKPRELQLVPLPESPNAYAAARCFQDSNGELRLLAAKGVYLYRDDRLALEKHLPVPDDVIMQGVVANSRGELWMATRGDGLLDFHDGKVNKITTRDGLSDNFIEALCLESDETLWLSTRNGGLNRIKGGEIKRYNTPWGYSGQVASTLACDRNQVLWVGTTGNGLFEMSGGHFNDYTEKDGLPSLYIRTLLPDDDGSIWVGTSKGLCKIREKRIASIAGRGGLPSDAVLRLADDQEGNLWMGTDSGIYRFRKQDLNAFADGNATFVNSVQYGREDGLPVLQCLPDADFETGRGVSNVVWFLTSKGLVVAKRALSQENRVAPSVFLENAVLDTKTVPLTNVVRVPPGNERVQFQFNALSLTAPGKIKFRYQLEGFDRAWSDPTTARSAQYPKIPPGTYRFRATACNNDGVWNKVDATAEIIVVPFWWATTTFRLTVATGIAAICAGIYSLKVTRLRALERLRVRIARDLHDEIGSSLWSITLLTRMLAKHGSLGSNERTDLEEIHQIASRTSNSIRDIIWLINPSFDTVQELLLRVQDFARTILRGVDYRLVTEKTNLSRKLSPELRQNLFLVFKEALTNIARHSDATVAEVRIEELRGGWCVSISDNGKGFEPTELVDGNGLRNLQARAKKIGGQLKIQSQPGKGATLLFTIEKWSA